MSFSPPILRLAGKAALSVPLDVDECATALYLAEGDIGKAAPVENYAGSTQSGRPRLAASGSSASPRLMRLKAVLLAPEE